MNGQIYARSNFIHVHWKQLAIHHTNREVHKKNWKGRHMEEARRYLVRRLKVFFKGNYGVLSTSLTVQNEEAQLQSGLQSLVP